MTPMTPTDRALVALWALVAVVAVRLASGVALAGDAGAETSEPAPQPTGTCIAWQARAEHLRSERDRLADQLAALRVEVAELRQRAATALVDASSQLIGLADDLGLCTVALDAGAAAPRCDCSWWAPALIGCAACGGSIGGSWLGVELERGLGR